MRIYRHYVEVKEGSHHYQLPHQVRRLYQREGEKAVFKPHGWWCQQCKILVEDKEVTHGWK